MFSSDVIRSMTREVIQNSIDARLPTAKSIEVRFTVLDVPREEVPDIEELGRHIAACQKYTAASFKADLAKYEENGKSAYEWAERILKSDTIAVLRIRDENTTGLEGDDDSANSAWDRLIRQQGAPGMHGDGGGSHGIGQLAPFAVSRLRTVMYGTKTPDGFRFIGKSIWRSIPSDDDWLQNIGFWGRDAHRGVTALQEETDVAAVFRRDTVGTDLFLVGFDPRLSHDEENAPAWHRLILDAVLKNFFAAIAFGRLAVTIDIPNGAPLRLDETTLETEFDRRIESARIEVQKKNTKKAEKDFNENLLWPRQYVAALRTHKPFEFVDSLLGKMQLFVTRDEHGSCKVAHMRSPLLLVHERTLNVLSKYAAVFVCEDKKGNELLRRFEGPEHDSWLKKVPGRDDAVNELNRFIRASLDQLVSANASEAQDVEGLADYLPEDLPTGPTSATGGVKVTQRVTDQESGKREPKAGKKSVRRTRQLPPVRVSPPDQSDLGTDDGDGHEGTSGQSNDGTGGKIGNGNNPGDGVGQLGVEGTKRPRIRSGELHFRSWFSSAARATRVVVTASRTGEARLRLRAVGEDTAYDLGELELEDTVSGERISSKHSVFESVMFTRSTPRSFWLHMTPVRRMALTLEVIDGA